MINKIITGIALLCLMGSSAWAQLVFEPQLARDIVFPDTPVGQSSEINYTATSRGNGPWNVRLNTNNQRFAVAPNQFVVQNGQAVQFILRFSPNMQGVVNGLLSGSYDNGNEVARINSNLSGRGVQGGPRIAVDPDTLDFYIYTDELGTIWQSTEVTVTVSNPGNADLNVQSITDPVNWLVCDRNAFVIRGGQSVDVVFSVPEDELAALDPDFYETTITINSNGGNQQRLTIPVYFYRGFVPHYLVVLGEEEPASEHALLVAAATIEGEDLDLWDEVGVFTPRGDLAGAGVLEAEFPIAFLAWGDDPEGVFAGFREDEAFEFRIWDESASREYRAIAQFIEGPERYAPDGVSELTLASAPDLVEQVIPLRRGWSAISFRIRPEDRYWVRQEGPDIIRVFETVRDNTQIVKNGAGAFYIPARGFNGIPYIRLEQGLQVRMAAADTLVIRGIPIPPDQEIALSRGWNLVAYYPNAALTMAAAFEDLTGRNLLLIAKDAFGRFYLPGVNFGGNNLINPNSALLVNVTENCTFHYPADQIAGLNRPEQTDQDSTVHFRDPEPTDNNMSVLITQLDGIVVRSGAELACLTPDGLVAGAIRLSADPPWGMAVWGDDSFTEDVVEGFHDDEPLKFLYYDGIHDWELETSFDVIEGGAPVYQANTLMVIGVHVGVNGEEPALPTELALEPPYPNPFNAAVKFRFDIPWAGAVSLRLIDLKGREQMTIASGWFAAGAHSRTVDASSLPAGIYLAVLEANGRRITRTAVLLK